MVLEGVPFSQVMDYKAVKPCLGVALVAILDPANLV